MFGIREFMDFTSDIGVIFETLRKSPSSCKRCREREEGGRALKKRRAKEEPWAAGYLSASRGFQYDERVAAPLHRPRFFWELLYRRSESAFGQGSFFHPAHKGRAGGAEHHSYRQRC